MTTCAPSLRSFVICSERVRQGSETAGRVRALLNDMAMRQNNWTLGAYCAAYCTLVSQHHGLEDTSIFPHLRRAEALDLLTDTLLSHLAYEEQQIMEPIARYGFYAGQV